MNREETLALYEQGVEAWNKWANEMLEERKRLEEAGEWQVEKVDLLLIKPINEVTKKWINKAEANFSTPVTPHTFNKILDFSNYIFPMNTHFKRAVFTKEVNFKDCKFYGTPSFYEANFEKTASFRNVKFYDNVLFLETNFNDKVLFNKADFYKNISFSNTNFLNYSSFKNVTFCSRCSFSAIQCENRFFLNEANFNNEIPDFIQANFKEAPRLDHIELSQNVPPGSFINSITTFIDPDIKVRYQALKRLAIQAHDHENEQRFWAGELRSDRSLRTEDGGWNLRPLVSAFWWGNIAYGCVSDYGRSIVRPIGALLILIGLMTGLHLTKSNTPLTYDQAFSAGYIAANKSFLYIGADPTKRNIIKEKYTALYGANENQTPKIPKTILTTEFFQTLLSAIFIFLALLGIRNNFKMK